VVSDVSRQRIEAGEHDDAWPDTGFGNAVECTTDRSEVGTLRVLRFVHENHQAAALLRDLLDNSGEDLLEVGGNALGDLRSLSARFSFIDSELESLGFVAPVVAELVDRSPDPAADPIQSFYMVEDMVEERRVGLARSSSRPASTGGCSAKPGRYGLPATGM